MTTMTFLWIPNGTTAAQDSGGPVTVTTDGLVSYSAGYWAATQGVLIPTNEQISIPGSASTATAGTGSAIVRFRRTVDSGSYQAIVGFGLYGNNSFLALRVGVSDTLEIVVRRGGGPVTTIPVTGAVGVNTDYVAYLEWSGTSVGGALDAASVNHGTRSYVAGDVFVSTTPYTIGSVNLGSIQQYLQGRTDGLAIFDGPLMDNQRAYLISRTTPWTWRMPMDIYPGYIDVLPLAGTNAVAPIEPLT